MELSLKNRMLLLLDEMQTKANNNPETIKTSTFEIFIEEMSVMVHAIPEEKTSWEGSVDRQGGSFSQEEIADAGWY